MGLRRRDGKGNCRGEERVSCRGFRRCGSRVGLEYQVGREAHEEMRPAGGQLGTVGSWGEGRWCGRVFRWAQGHCDSPPLFIRRGTWLKTSRKPKPWVTWGQQLPVLALAHSEASSLLRWILRARESLVPWGLPSLPADTTNQLIPVIQLPSRSRGLALHIRSPSCLTHS